MFVFTHGRGMRDRYLYSHLEEECGIYVCIHIWKRNVILMFAFTFGIGKRDRCLYLEFKEECGIDVGIHIWKRNAR